MAAAAAAHALASHGHVLCIASLQHMPRPLSHVRQPERSTDACCTLPSALYATPPRPLQAMAIHGRRWSKVAALVAGRTDVQCRERFMNCLNPGALGGAELWGTGVGVAVAVACTACLAQRWAAPTLPSPALPLPCPASLPRRGGHRQALDRGGGAAAAPAGAAVHAGAWEAGRRGSRLRAEPLGSKAAAPTDVCSFCRCAGRRPHQVGGGGGGAAGAHRQALHQSIQDAD